LIQILIIRPELNFHYKYLHVSHVWKIISLHSSSNQARMNSDRTTEADRAREDRRVARAAFLCSRPVSFFEYGG